MNSLSKFSIYSIALLSSMSLLMVVGCAGNDSVKQNINTSIADVSQENINSSVMEEDESLNNAGVITTGNTDILIAQEMPDINQPEDVSTVITETVDEQVVTNLEGIEPEKKIVSFSFDQSTVISDYGDMLWKHAQYLRQNNDLVLQVSGHTDASGARLYNELLSKKRAQEVAQVLIDFGAPREQIKIIGLADDQPLVGAKTHREHRRVELDYQQQQIVSN